MNLSVHALSLALRIPATRLHEIVKERCAITPDTALRLTRYFFGTTPALWINLQTAYDLRRARLEYGAVVEREVFPRAA